jgi:hypothetical protein
MAVISSASVGSGSACAGVTVAPRLAPRAAGEGAASGGWCRGRYQAERQPSVVQWTTVCPEMLSVRA